MYANLVDHRSSEVVQWADETKHRAMGWRLESRTFLFFPFVDHVLLGAGGITENVFTDVLCASVNPTEFRGLVNWKPTPDRERVGKDGLEETGNISNDVLEAIACSVRQIHDYDKHIMEIRYIASAVACRNLHTNRVCEVDLVVTCKVVIGV